MDSAEEVMDSASATSDVDSATEVSEVEEDLKELKLFLGQAQRPRVKELLQDDIKKLESEASAAAAASKAPEMPVVREETVASAPQQKRLPTKKLDTYGWDQSDKFMKIYITLNGVNKLPKENIISEFTKSTFVARIEDLNGKNYELKVTRLFKDIIPGESYHKVKTDMVTIFMKKAEQSKTWAYVTDVEQKLKDMKESREPKADEKDPLMSMMKKMYDEGDDEMKRSINKAWCESQEKRNAGQQDFNMPQL
ncbi:calcyclin-binding protein-like isoform X3 [Lineus longissimus]|uniref:calcyclin-binding protein-like isoform X3 n=1 Tax=Lineus longissimus TaxID=88925 RepID=UPI00315C81F6